MHGVVVAYVAIKISLLLSFLLIGVLDVLESKNLQTSTRC